MQDNKFLTKEKTQALIDGLGIKQNEGKAFLDGLAAKGYTIQGYNDQPKVEEKSLINDLSKRGSNMLDIAKNTNINPLSRGLQGLGQIAGGAGDVIGAGIGAAASGIDNATGNVISNTAKSILQTPIGQEGLKLAQENAEGYAAWKQANPEAAGNLEAVVNIGTLLPVGAGANVVKNIAAGTAEGVAKGAMQVAKTGLEKVATAPIVSGTGEVLKSAGRTLKTIPENIATNVNELKAAEQAIKALPSITGQNAVRKGLDITDATTLQKAIQTPEAKNLIQTIKNYAAGDKSVSPFEVVGKPIVARLKTLDTQVKDFASQLDTVAQSLKGQSINDLTKIQSSVLDGLDKLQIKISKGGLDFIDSSLEGIGGSGKIIDNVYKRVEKAKDAFDLHNLKKYIDANVSYGKRVEGLDAGAERLLKTWRKAIDDTLDTQFTEYNKVNTELAKRISPLEDLKGILKNTDGLDTDLLKEKAGILARRITSAAPSNPEIKQILRNLDSFTSGKGKTLGKIENLQDLYNVLNKYYDIAPKTGFQNLVKEGANPSGIVDEATQAIKGFAGSTNATRQKALEDYLTELLAKPSKAKN